MSRTLSSSSTRTTTEGCPTPGTCWAEGSCRAAASGAPSYRGRNSLTVVPWLTALSSVAMPPACLAKP
ncbi:hypothetical protein G6F45_014324 [Rhizopus arrhizus]|nr:hypothetical protein G6F45_014324 [Rhizopus arrhizus]